MPDRPIVFRPCEPIRVPPGGRLQCFIEVPVWIGIHFAGSPQTLLFSTASQILSNTWFGSPTSGELAYAIKAEMNRDETRTSGRPDSIVCPVRIRNRTSNPLDCSRLCLRTQFLGIYRGEHMLWSNESSLSYHGEEEWNKVAYATSAPAYDKADALLSGPREQSKSRFALRSFTSGVDLP